MMLMMTGRVHCKSEEAAIAVTMHAVEHPEHIIQIVTSSVHKTFIALQEAAGPNMRPTMKNRLIQWPNGASAYLFTNDDHMRGLRCHLGWAHGVNDEALQHLESTVRLSKDKRVLVSP